MNIENIIHGDMPGDKIKIEDNHIHRAEVLFPRILEKIEKTGNSKIVISVYGGSGVGKSEIGSLIGHFCKEKGMNSYVLSGDNYPYRFPEANDAERLNRFRYGGLAALAQSPDFTDKAMISIRETWESGNDADAGITDGSPLFKLYRKAGKESLHRYLGTADEIDFPLINSIIRKFKDGQKTIPLKRMGRTTEEIWFEAVDVSKVQILILEWTHGNNPCLEGVDFPVYLFSTPAETLAHRLGRGRDKGADSPFISLVLELEQEKLNRQAGRASLIISKAGELLSMEDLKKRMGN